MHLANKFSRKNIFYSVLTFILITFVGTQTAWAKPPKDKIKRISDPIPITSSTGEATTAVDINDRNVVVGTYGGLYGIARSFTWTKRKGFKDIGEFTATAINNCGDVAGVLNLSYPGLPVHTGNPTNAVIIRDGQIIDLGKLDSSSPTSWAYATDINDRGHVSGIAGDQATSTTIPFIWTPETGMRALDTPEFHSGALALNNRDQIVGFKQADPFNGSQGGALWTPGQPVRLFGRLGGRTGSGSAINDSAEVVGNSDTSFLLFPLRAGFFWSETDGLIPLQPYESQEADTANQARDINSHGLIVGSISAVDAPGSSRPQAALWTSPANFFIFGDIASEAIAINDRGRIVGNMLADNLTSSGAVFWKLNKKLYQHSQGHKFCRYRKIIDEKDDDDEDDD